MNHKLAIIIPTFRRIGGLQNAVDSVFKQKDVPNFELIVVDNDPGGSALEVAQSLAKTAPEHVEVIVRHEKAPGVATARNTAMAATDATLIAFLDDDQTADPMWLRHLLNNYETYKAASTFCPTKTVLPDGVENHTAYFEKFFAREYDANEGLIPDYFGIGNSLLDRTQTTSIVPLFDVRTDESGGEDDLLYGELQKLGKRFSWSTQAVAYEHVPETRVNLSYTLRRAFAYGQGPVSSARQLKPGRIDIILFWMLVGGAKATLNSLIYAFKFIIRAEDRANNLDQIFRGLGKIFWWHKMEFYGAAQLKKKKTD